MPARGRCAGQSAGRLTQANHYHSADIARAGTYPAVLSVCVRWGGGGLADVGKLRARYVAALKAADNHDIGPLLAFARA